MTRPVARRGLVKALLLAFALGTAALAGAQTQPNRLLRVGFLLLGPEQALWNSNLPRRITEMGWVDGKSIQWVVRAAHGNPERLPELAAQLAATADVIVAMTNVTAFEAKRATQTVPIVVWGAHGALETGLVGNLARPGGNITGMDSLAPEIDAKRVQLLREMLPRLQRLGTLSNPADAGSPVHLKVTTESGARFGIGITSQEVRRPADYDGMLAALAKSPPDALLTFADALTYQNWGRVAEFALEHRIPTMCEFKQMAQAGCLVSYGPSFAEFDEITARQVDRVLRGTNPAVMPVERPTRFELIVNMKTARALGVTIPQTVLLRADEVID